MAGLADMVAVLEHHGVSVVTSAEKGAFLTTASGTSGFGAHEFQLAVHRAPAAALARPAPRARNPGTKIRASPWLLIGAAIGHQAHRARSAIGGQGHIGQYRFVGAILADRDPMAIIAEPGTSTVTTL
jgi:hypothetical protein